MVQTFFQKLSTKFLRTTSSKEEEVFAIYEDTAWSTGSDLSSESEALELFTPAKSPMPENTWNGLEEVRGEILYDFDQTVNFWEVDQSSYTYPYLSLLCFSREYGAGYWEVGLEGKSTVDSELWDESKPTGVFQGTIANQLGNMHRDDLDCGVLWDVIDLDWHYAQDLELDLREKLGDVETDKGDKKRGVDYNITVDYSVDVMDSGDIADLMERCSISSPLLVRRAASEIEVTNENLR